MPAHIVEVEPMAHVRRQNGCYRGVQLGPKSSQEGVSRSCKKVAMPKVPDMQSRSSTSNACHIYSGSNRLSTASMHNELYRNRNGVCSPTFSSKHSTMGKTRHSGDTFEFRRFIQPENTTASESNSALLNRPSNYWPATACPAQPRALGDRGTRPSSTTCHSPATNGALGSKSVDGQDPPLIESAMKLLPVIKHINIEDNCSQSAYNSFEVMRTGDAGNRNSTGSTDSQTSSGFESGKHDSSIGVDLSNLVSSNSSSSCASSNIVTGVNPMDNPSSRISSSGSTTSEKTTGSRLSTYYTSMDEYCYDQTGVLSCSGASASNIMSPETVTSKPPKSSKGASSYSRVNIREMMAKGIPESEILAEWLQRLCLSHCLALFISQGYDLMSISKITPEDLTTLGISKPADRKRLMQDIQTWNIVDNWPTDVTTHVGIREWLISIGLRQYIDLFENQGYTTMHELQKIAWEDLEDIGINKLGHMKRICLALKKLKLGRSAVLREEDCNLVDSSDYGLFQAPCLPSTSCSITTTFQANSSAASDSGCGTTTSSSPTCYDNTGFMSPYLSLNTRYTHQHQNQHQSRSLLDTGPKQRPIVTVRPNKQPISSIEDGLGDDGVVYKNTCFGLPKLNLYRTSQILSEFSELPKSIDGEPMAVPYQRYNAPFYSHDCPPPPAPMPSTAASKQTNAMRQDQTASYFQSAKKKLAQD